MCASTRPRTSPNEYLPFDGVPLAVVTASGNSAQPVALSKLKRPAEPGSTSASLPPPTPSALPCDGSMTLNEPPEASSSFQSPSGPPSLARVKPPPMPGSVPVSALRNVLFLSKNMYDPRSVGLRKNGPSLTDDDADFSVQQSFASA